MTCLGGISNDGLDIMSGTAFPGYVIICGFANTDACAHKFLHYWFFLQLHVCSTAINKATYRHNVSKILLYPAQTLQRCFKTSVASFDFFSLLPIYPSMSYLDCIDNEKTTISEI